jgi:uncharacterized protein YcfJ
MNITPSVRPVKTILLPTLLAMVSGVCAAQEVGWVLSATHMVQQVGVPRQVCTTQQVWNQAPKSGAGAAMGAIAGGALGNAVGQGGGRAAATMLGMFGGAILGDRVEGNGPTQIQNVQNCTTQNFYENRNVGYNVMYDYAGKQYAVQMPNDPGPTVQLQITPVGANAPQASANSYAQPPAVQEFYTEQVYVAPQPRYATRPYYPPVGINLDFGYYRGGHRGHWR